MQLKFRTEIKEELSHIKITHEDQLFFIGSCFSSNIGKKMQEYKFQAMVNPFGILYNPHSIGKCLDHALTGKQFKEVELREFKGIYFSYDFHSDLSDTTEAGLLEKVNNQLTSSREKLQNCKVLFITLGTAWVYRLKENKRIVANCHKQASDLFEKEMMQVPEIEEALKKSIQSILDINPSIKILFTVSPVRHLKDGFHNNQLSKSSLLLGVDAICKQFEACHYFHAYEIFMDDLRDYRYCSEDLLHPNSMAVEYIWQKFSEKYFHIETHQLLEEIESLKTALAHKAFHPKSVEHQKFLSKLKDKITKLSNRKHLDYTHELIFLEQQIENQ